MRMTKKSINNEKTKIDDIIVNSNIFFYNCIPENDKYAIDNNLTD